MDEMDEAAPEPAAPILASSLLDLEIKQRRRFAAQGERISTGCREVDEVVLGGDGLERGIVVGVSAEGGQGRLVSLHLIASILLSYAPTMLRPAAQSRATIIDTTGSFPISLLAKVIKSRILEKKEESSRRDIKTDVYKSTQPDAVGNKGLEDEVQRCLEMVAISRVFDVEGLWEVLSEVGRDDRSNLDCEHPQEGLEAGDAVGEAGIGENDLLQKLPKPSIVGEIGDSEDESTPDEDEVAMTEQPVPRIQKQAAPQMGAGGAEVEVTEIIIVDNMTNIINELFARKEKSEAHNILSILSNIIHNLSSQSNILTILHNSTISSKSSYPPDLDPHSLSRRQLQQSNPFLSSVFPSSPLKPALGRVFDQFPSLHLLLSPIPKTREDAETLYGGDAHSHVQYSTILEVLKDETPNIGKPDAIAGFGARERRWVALVVGEDGLRFSSASGKKGEGRGG